MADVDFTLLVRLEYVTHVYVAWTQIAAFGITSLKDQIHQTLSHLHS